MPRGIYPRKKIDPLLRFNGKWELSTEHTYNGEPCWEWTGFIFPKGYGKFDTTYAHRWSYEHFVGPIPEGLEIDHLCVNRACCNPAHLEAVTHLENVRRGRNAHRDKTHCPQGHVYDYIVPKTGYRQCRTCNLEDSRRHQARRLTAA